jgi:ion channel-forming bestrophin family protein
MPQDPDRFSWMQYTLRLRGSVIPAVLPRTLICGLFAILISAIHALGMPVDVPALASVVSNVVLGLMLVFRTNTAYERFWEGRKLWGSVTNASRNLARSIWVIIPDRTPSDPCGICEAARQDKRAALDLIVAFAVTLKLHLRREAVNEELQPFLAAPQYENLKGMNNPPLEVAFWIQDYLQQQHDRDRLNIHQLVSLQLLLNTMVDSLGGCERILKTPIPMAYAIHLKQLLLIYCFTLPFQFVTQLGWWTAAVVMLISFTLFGIEAIGMEIENPFGRDHNDLPLDAICDTMKRNIDDLTKVEPITR